jgi:hypothetical protein
MNPTVDEPSVLDYIHRVIVPLGITNHYIMATLAHTIYKPTHKSCLEDGRFILYKQVDGSWIRYAHNDLFINDLRTVLGYYIDKARYSVKSPPAGTLEYDVQFYKWHTSILKLLELYEQLHDYNYIKCILEELLLFLYDPSFVAPTP